MAVLLRPKRWAGKPLVGAVDPSHPLAASLRTCYLFGQAAGLPLDIGGASGSAFDGTPAWAQTPGGPGLVTASGSGVHSLDTSYNLSAGNFTVRVVHMPASLSAFAALYEKVNGASREASFFIGSSGQLSFWQISGTSGSTSPSGLAMTAGKVWDVVFVRRLPGQLSVYLNGVLLGDSTAGAATGTGAISGSRVTLGLNASGGGQSYAGTYISSQTWTRALNSAEIAQLYVDPYAFILPQAPRQRYWSVPPSTVDATVVAVVATGSGQAYAPTVSGSATVTPVLATATAAAAAPTLAANASITAVASTATGTATPPTITGGATVLPPAATATGTAQPPPVTANASVTAATATATSTFNAPVGTGDATVTAPCATATAQAYPPTYSLTATILAPCATATGLMYAPTATATVPNIRGYSSSSIAALSSSTTSLTPAGSSTSALSTAGASTASVG